MNETDNPTAPSEESQGGIPEPRVPVDFVVGTKSLPLEDLRSLSEGYVFELPENASSVSLIINGRKYGSGRLVRVGDHLGVVVETLGEH